MHTINLVVHLLIIVKNIFGAIYSSTITDALKMKNTIFFVLCMLFMNSACYSRLQFCSCLLPRESLSRAKDFSFSYPFGVYDILKPDYSSVRDKYVVWGLLPFLGSSHICNSRVSYSEHDRKGLLWLMTWVNLIC